MTRIIFSLLFFVIPFCCQAQDEQPFKGKFYNAEYQVFLIIDAYDQKVTVPGQELFGEIPGYLGSKRDGRVWLITEVTIKNPRSATIEVINDYGSEDFIAQLSFDDEGNLIMKHEKGSTYKIVVNRKYVKIPSKIVLKKE